MTDQVQSGATAAAREVDQRLDLRELISFLWRQWKFIAIVTAVVMLVGVTLLLRQTPLYPATSQVLLDRQREKAPGAEAILTDLNLDMAMIESQMAIIRSSVFLRRVVEKERLASDPQLSPRNPPDAGTSLLGSVQSLVGRAPTREADPAPVTMGSDS